jgi:hypothetical protein
MKVIDRLIAYHPHGAFLEWEIPMLEADIERKKKSGWSDNEIVSCMRWLEHVDSTIDEDTAIRRMREVRNRVEARLSKETM